MSAEKRTVFLVKVIHPALGAQTSVARPEGQFKNNRDKYDHLPHFGGRSKSNNVLGEKYVRYILRVKMQGGQRLHYNSRNMNSRSNIQSYGDG